VLPTFVRSVANIFYQHFSDALSTFFVNIFVPKFFSICKMFTTFFQRLEQQLRSSTSTPFNLRPRDARAAAREPAGAAGSAGGRD
jgi:hypothetical protein